MTRIIHTIAIATVLAACCVQIDAALLSVEADFDTPAPGDFTIHSVFHSVSASFLVLVTGGTGPALLYPDLTLDGSTNEAAGKGLYALLGGIASTTWPELVSVGDPTSFAVTVPEFNCPNFFSPTCAVPFTFGVPFTFNITLTASSEEQLQAGAPVSGFAAEAVFNGIAGFTDLDGRRIFGEATITELPEPASVVLFGGGGLMLLGLVIYKRRIAYRGAAPEVWSF
jgi:hypothetical protein